MLSTNQTAALYTEPQAQNITLRLCVRVDSDTVYTWDRVAFRDPTEGKDILSQHVTLIKAGFVWSELV